MFLVANPKCKAAPERKIRVPALRAPRIAPGCAPPASVLVWVLNCLFYDLNCVDVARVQ
jgi:hypothetical protein